jgi:hypothetical protein
MLSRIGLSSGSVTRSLCFAVFQPCHYVVERVERCSRVHFVRGRSSFLQQLVWFGGGFGMLVFRAGVIWTAAALLTQQNVDGLVQSHSIQRCVYLLRQKRTA